MPSAILNYDTISDFMRTDIEQTSLTILAQYLHFLIDFSDFLDEACIAYMQPSSCICRLLKITKLYFYKKLLITINKCAFNLILRVLSKT